MSGLRDTEGILLGYVALTTNLGCSIACAVELFASENLVKLFADFKSAFPIAVRKLIIPWSINLVVLGICDSAQFIWNQNNVILFFIS